LKFGSLTLTVVAGACILANVTLAYGQSGPNCSGEHFAVCGSNPNPSSIPSNLGGARMTADTCANVLVEALASSYSYDDPACYRSTIQSGNDLHYVGDALEYLTPGFGDLARDYDLSASLYCSTGSSPSLVLAFRGSARLTPSLLTPLLTADQFSDWIATNIAELMGQLSIQYIGSRDIAFQIKNALADDKLNDICGTGRPNLVLTGHSKGGGQAQYAAIEERLDAVVFNANPVNPIIFTSYMSNNDYTEITRYLRNLQREAKSVIGCFLDTPDIASTTYYGSGRIRDVRTVTDFIAKYFLANCNIPHAPIEWLVDTFTCTAKEGHGIGSVVRELGACASVTLP
jgi:hypothetical protein